MIHSEKVSDRKHVPDQTRLPKCVTGWQEMDAKRLWGDGTQILVAVPVCDTRHPAQDWYYEFSIVVIKCDEVLFGLETPDGDAWAWDLDSVDYYVILSD